MRSRERPAQRDLLLPLLLQLLQHRPLYRCGVCPLFVPRVRLVSHLELLGAVGELPVNPPRRLGELLHVFLSRPRYLRTILRHLGIPGPELLRTRPSIGDRREHLGPLSQRPPVLLGILQVERLYLPQGHVHEAPPPGGLGLGQRQIVGREDYHCDLADQLPRPGHGHIVHRELLLGRAREARRLGLHQHHPQPHRPPRAPIERGRDDGLILPPANHLLIAGGPVRLRPRER